MYKVTLSYKIASVLALAIFSGIGSTNAATINFSGIIEFIFNNGSNTYSSVSVGDAFSGSFSYGNSASDGVNTGIGDYQFLGGGYTGFISNGTTTVQNTIGEAIEVGIGNNLSLGEDYLLVNNLLGTTYGATDQFDAWDVEGQYRDTNGKLEFGILFLFDTSVYSDSGFHVSPPEYSSVELAYFAVQEFDEFNNRTFLGYGKLSSVPVPAAVWLFSSGLLGILALSKRNKSSRLISVNSNA